MSYHIVILTDSRFVNPKPEDVYISNVLFEDELLETELKKLGLTIKRVAWDDPYFDWSTTKYALFRAVWDYFDRIQEFKNWYHRTKTITHFINPPAIIDWNIDKHYLKDLERNGVRIPQTFIVESGTVITLEEALKKSELSGEFFILKPCIAGGARETYKFHKNETESLNPTFQKLIAQEAMMLQEFQHNIVSEGEISLMVMNGKFTHAILKKAKAGDFRVQDDYGGTVHDYHPTPSEIDFALKAVNACPEKPMYARVDIFKDNHDQWALAELELFEPELWFRFKPTAAQLLAQEIYNTYL